MANLNDVLRDVLEKDFDKDTVDPVSYTHLDVYKRQYTFHSRSGNPLPAKRCV